MVLQKLKQAAEDYLGEKVTDAVITTYFNDSQRQATKDAGKIAGLNVLGLSTSRQRQRSRAASTRRTRRSRSTTSAAARSIFRFSRVGEGIVEVKSTNGDTHLGGDDFDQKIVDWLTASSRKATASISARTGWRSSA